MPYDSLTVRSITKEIKSKLIKTKIHKIYQPVSDEVILYFSDKDKSVLLLCANATFPRIHTTDERFENPEQPPAFCMLLRKYLIGGIVTDIVQKDYDRIVMFKIENLDETGSLIKLNLIVEIMGRHSNIILVNEKSGKVLDSIKHISPQKSSVRQLRPTLEYKFPPEERVSPLDFDIDEVNIRLSFFSEKALSNALLSVFSGLSNQWIKSFFIDNDIDKELSTREFLLNNPDEFWRAFKEEFSCIDEVRKSYIYLEEDGRYKDFSCGEYSIFGDNKKITFDTTDEMLKEYYKAKSVVNHISQRYEEAIKKLSSIISKEENKLKIREEELANAEGYEKFNIFGNLLFSNLHLMKKGDSSVVVQNYYENPPVDIEIKIREDRNPTQNAQLYFKKYTRAKSAITHLTKLIEETKEDIYFLESQKLYLINANNTAEADEVIEVLSSAGYLKKKKKLYNKKQPLSTPHHYITSDGFDIYVGKNDNQNDKLTLKSSQKDDIWLHTKTIAGSHVILKTNNGHYSEEALHTASMLSAYYSKARNSQNVPVDYTLIKYVKKPSGAKAGKVIYTNQKTLLVTPTEEFIKSVKLLG